jgi:hypothetical protein
MRKNRTTKKHQRKIIASQKERDEEGRKKELESRSYMGFSRMLKLDLDRLVHQGLGDTRCGNVFQHLDEAGYTARTLLAVKDLYAGKGMRYHEFAAIVNNFGVLTHARRVGFQHFMYHRKERLHAYSAKNSEKMKRCWIATMSFSVGEEEIEDLFCYVGDSCNGMMYPAPSAGNTFCIWNREKYADYDSDMYEEFYPERYFMPLGWKRPDWIEIDGVVSYTTVHRSSPIKVGITSTKLRLHARRIVTSSGFKNVMLQAVVMLGEEMNGQRVVEETVNVFKNWKTAVVVYNSLCRMYKSDDYFHFLGRNIVARLETTGWKCMSLGNVPGGLHIMRTAIWGHIGGFDINVPIIGEYAGKKIIFQICGFNNHRLEYVHPKEWRFMGYSEDQSGAKPFDEWTPRLCDFEIDFGEEKIVIKRLRVVSIVPADVFDIRELRLSRPAPMVFGSHNPE